MGSTPLDIRRAEVMCQREVLGSWCDDDDVKLSFLAEAPAHEVTVSFFFIDRTEVSVGAYARCVATGACPSPRAPSLPFAGSSASISDPSALPVTYVDWGAASTYCKWAGGRLPTEAEWEFAARGTEDRKFPWGNVYNPTLCNHGSLARDSADKTDGFAGLAPVGSFPDGATPTGLLDLAGNVKEWVSDFFDVDSKGFGYSPSSQANPKGPTTGSFHVVRGGSYADGAPWMRGASRGYAAVATAFIGFRCAADSTRTIR